MSEGTRRAYSSRNTHRKSRLGCLNCKSRRVKCDETRPACENCAKRSLSCRYSEVARSSHGPSSSSRESSIPSSHVTVLQDSTRQQPTPPTNAQSSVDMITPASLSSPFVQAEPAMPQLGIFDASDMELMHHYSTVVMPMFDEDGRNSMKWRKEMLNVAFNSLFSIHAMFSVSALHLARNADARKSQHYVAKAAHHHSIALAAMLDSLAHINEADFDALFVCSTFLCFHSFALGPQPGQYIGFCDEGEPELMSLLRGVRSICDVQVPGILRNWTANFGQVTKFEQLNRPAESPTLWTEFRQQLAELRRFAAPMRAEDASFGKYTVAIDALEQSFSNTLSSNSISEDTPLSSQDVFPYLYRLEPDFVTALQEKRPFALVVFAFFNVLLYQIRHIWYLEGWPEHIMTGIHANIHEDYRHWLDWPSRTIRWSPSSSTMVS